MKRARSLSRAGQFVREATEALDWLDEKLTEMMSGASRRRHYHSRRRATGKGGADRVTGAGGIGGKRTEDCGASLADVRALRRRHEAVEVELAGAEQRLRDLIAQVRHVETRPPGRGNEALGAPFFALTARGGRPAPCARRSLWRAAPRSRPWR